MKKIIALASMIICILVVSACTSSDPEMVRKTTTGEIVNIDLDKAVLTVLDENTNEEITFTIALLVPESRGVEHYVETLSIGDIVTVEAEFPVDCEAPYPAGNVSASVK